jgi:hypothetical protein
MSCERPRQAYEYISDGSMLLTARSQKGRTQLKIQPQDILQAYFKVIICTRREASHRLKLLTKLCNLRFIFDFFCFFFINSVVERHVNARFCERLDVFWSKIVSPTGNWLTDTWLTRIWMTYIGSQDI